MYNTVHIIGYNLISVSEQLKVRGYHTETEHRQIYLNSKGHIIKEMIVHNL